MNEKGVKIKAQDRRTERVKTLCVDTKINREKVEGEDLAEERNQTPVGDKVHMMISF